MQKTAYALIEEALGDHINAWAGILYNSPISIISTLLCEIMTLRMRIPL